VAHTIIVENGPLTRLWLVDLTGSEEPRLILRMESQSITGCLWISEPEQGGAPILIEYPPPRPPSPPTAPIARGEIQFRPQISLEGPASAFSPDGRFFACGGASIQIWDLQEDLNAPGAVRLLPGHTEMISDLAFHPNGRNLVSGSADHTLRVWDIERAIELSALRAAPETLEEIPEMLRFGSHPNVTQELAVLPDGVHLITAVRSQRGLPTLRLWNLQTGEEIPRFPDCTVGILDFDLSPDGSRALTVNTDHTIRIWDVETGSLVNRLTAMGFVQTAGFFPGDDRVLAGSGEIHGRENPTLAIIDVSANEITQVLDSGSDPQSIAVLPDGRHALTGSNRDRQFLRLWDLERGAVIHTFEEAERPATRIVLSSDGRRASTLGRGYGEVQLWALPDL
jgi:WD40 repeat protein